MLERVEYIALGQPYPQHLGIELVSVETDHVVLRLPYRDHLGTDRVQGGAISSLIDVAGVCATWAHPDIGPDSFGATVSLTINFLQLAVAADLTATARVRRRGGSICVTHIVVSNDEGEDIAVGTLTYKLQPRKQGS